MEDYYWGKNPCCFSRFIVINDKEIQMNMEGFVSSDCIEIDSFDPGHNDLVVLNPKAVNICW